MFKHINFSDGLLGHTRRMLTSPFGASKTLLYMGHPKWPKTPSDPLGERTDVIRRRNLTP